MQLVRTTPLRQLLDAEREFHKMLDRTWDMAPPFGEISSADMYTEDDNLVAKVDLPGFKKEEIEVTATDEGLEISAQHKEKEEKETKRRYLLRESSQSFWRRLSLPKEAKTDKVKCTLKDGKLTVTMPLERKKIKPIPVE